MTTRTYSVGVRFTADENSLQRLALGGTIKMSAFTDTNAYGAAGQRVIPAGTLVKRDADKTLIPAVGTEPAGTVFITASDVVENPSIGRGSDLTTGLYVGGVIYEDKLPAGVPAAGFKTALGTKFTFQTAQGSLVVTE